MEDQDTLENQETQDMVCAIKKVKDKHPQKTLYIRFPFETWLMVAKRALEQQKQRGVVVIDILNEYFGLEVK